MIGRYIITPEIFEILGRIGPGAGGEIQLTDAMRELAKVQSIYGCRFSGERYDVGDKLGFLRLLLCIHWQTRNWDRFPPILK